ncbi:MAG: glycosyltransferase family 2 protein [Salinivirgaceae bacterium]|jgi:glycosyltransferase involved in cell wall biosynthesis|nr:glycosyltransferase family 2 protein [Salinivirgaceae bacterium]
MAKEKYNIKLSVIVPVYNDQEVLPELHKRLLNVLPEIADDYEIVLIDDGSADNSWKIIENLKNKDNRIVGIKLIRNFGQQNAIAAGFDNIDGDVIVLMDSDLQDKPEDIPKLLEALYETESSMAIAQWKSRQDKSLKIFVSRLFYWFSQKYTQISHQPRLGVFRAIQRSTIDELRKYQEKTSTTLSLLYYVGVDYVPVELERDPRFAGKSGYNLKKMLKLTIDRVFSFSMMPIRMAIFTGLIISGISFLAGIALIIRYFLGVVASGWTSSIVLILFLFGVNFLFLGIIGEYLGRIFLESKNRPKYVIKKTLK